MQNKLLKVLLIILSAAGIFAQTDKLPDKLPDELNQKQWEYVRDMYAIDAILLLAKLDTLNLEIDSLKLLKEYTENFDCEAELYAVVGATKEQVADYRKKLDEAETLTAKNSAPDDAARDLVSVLSKSRISCLPEFNERVAALRLRIDNEKYTVVTRTSEDMYTVVYGDVLTGISLKFYGTVDKWDVIWKANKNEVDNPDFIYPGQRLKIPLEK
ncbi:MAG TPA: LysM peptidoglycan-binding domain-containing protein [Ignavibacteria bacterium]|nr:LysM peptidoglycan-binding domain-containing protein [Ignavibacteria bacterium]HMR00426.1 LysM peptidoglycan-binding domain-containing protein [Ignavibacteria bacterium]